MAEYLHPSVSSKVNDNSEVFLATQGTTNLFAASLFERGPDNVLKEITSLDEYLFTYGTPNVSKYSQITLGIERWLSSGGRAFILRVLPSTATFANIFLSVKFAEKKVIVSSKSKAAGVSSKEAITTTLSTPEAGVEYLGAVIPKGRGKAYNGMGIRINLRTDMDDTYNFRTYNLSITAKDSTGADMVIDGPYLVSFDPEARSRSRESLYWSEVVTKYSKNFDILDNRGAFDKIASKIVADKEIDGEPVDPSKVDIIFGTERNLFNTKETIHDEYTWTQSVDSSDEETYNADAADFSKIQYLASGSDGKFVDGETEDALLAKAYSGVTVPAVRAKDLYEFDIILDGNTSSVVKNAMAELAMSREDCMTILDCGFQADPEQTITFRRDKVSMSSRCVAIFGQHMEVFDKYSGETVKVTSPYFLAERIPTIDNQNGIQYTFVGPRRGVISGFENINFYPNPMWKENLYLAQVNYIERDPKKINFATQLTSQTMNSALSQINNVRSLMRIRREVEKMMGDYRMEFNDDITYDSMSYNLNNYLQTWVANRACETISGSVYASDYDKNNNLVHVRIDVTFTGIIERVSIDINVNRR